MARKLAYLVPILLVFAIAFTLAVTTATPAKAHECCRLINHCPDGTKLYGWGKYNEYHVCVQQYPPGNCIPPMECDIP
ncbi:MAG: hypothetical protein JSV52_13050 [Candidatus Zixiibacteriota bacterium]|nr:MAG: hypothetical protein JSV52_13050 [candidate division Zixibacteria bacterium]